MEGCVVGRFGRVKWLVQVGGGLAVVSLLAAACSSGGASSGSGSGSSAGTSEAAEPVDIALVTDLTGAASSTGVEALAGVKTAVYQINAAGGVDGSKLQLATYDGQTTVSVDQNVTRQAIASKPAAIVSFLLSNETEATASLVMSGGVPWVGPSYPVAALSEATNWFSTSATDPAVATGTVSSLKAILGGSLAGKTVAFEGLQNPAVAAHITLMKQGVTSAGGTVGKVITDPAGITSWASQAQSVVSSGASALIVNTDEPDTAVIAKALGVAGFKGPIVSTESASSDSLLSGVNLPNFYAVRETLTPPQGSPVYAAASSAGNYTPVEVANPNFMKSYVAVYAVAAVLGKCGVSCPESQFVNTIRSLGDVKLPAPVMVGPLNFAKGLSGLTTAQAFGWDPAKNVAVPKGPTLNIQGL
jgi:ABC-type branched-subunit amino acid transport system substrate-binding protein